MSAIRAVLRLLFTGIWTAVNIAWILICSLFNGRDIRAALKSRMRFVRGLLPVVGVRLHVTGDAPDYPCLVLGNHRSYLDPVVLTHDTLAYAVSKAEVAHWPLIGYGIRITGTLFLTRESKTSRVYTLQAIAEKIKEGWPVILFPEGTTHADPQTAEFRAGAFKLAAQEQIPIVPVAIEYGTTEDYWIRDDTFFSHFLRRFAEPHMDVYVHYGAPVRGDDWKVLLDTTRQQIDRELMNIRKTF
jgi:1-acyl-sn-glycerol-3-phosphate acyltransferase